MPLVTCVWEERNERNVSEVVRVKIVCFCFLVGSGEVTLA